MYSELLYVFVRIQLYILFDAVRLHKFLIENGHRNGRKVRADEYDKSG